MFNNVVNANNKEVCKPDVNKCASCKNKGNCKTYYRFILPIFEKNISKEITPEEIIVEKSKEIELLEEIIERINVLDKIFNPKLSNIEKNINSFVSKIENISTAQKELDIKILNENKNLDSKINAILEIFKTYTYREDSNDVEESLNSNDNKPLLYDSTIVEAKESADSVFIEKTKKGFFGIGKKTEWVEVPKND